MYSSGLIKSINLLLVSGAGTKCLAIRSAAEGSDFGGRGVGGKGCGLDKKVVLIIYSLCLSCRIPLPNYKYAFLLTFVMVSQ